MKQYLLDTNAVISLVNNKNSLLVERVKECRPSEVCISSIVAHELYYGAFKSRKILENVALVDELQFEILEFDKEDARQAGKVRALLTLEGKPIGPYDVLIAGQARARKLTLISHNLKEFRRVKDLLLEDWEV